jgi:hypothetical protein
MRCKPHCGKLLIVVVLGIAVLGGVVMVLWNWLIPTLFPAGREISYLQAMGVLLLSKILFGGLRGHCGPGRWRRRWEEMTPEERERIEAGLGRCFGKGGMPIEKPEADHS